MSTGYQSLLLPKGLDTDTAKLIRDQLEPQLADVHAMLRLPIDSDPGLGGGCNLSATQVLLSVVSGVSVTVYDPSALTRRGDRGPLFREVLEKHYPWKEERHLPGARLDAAAAVELYRLFRNPLAHTLGVVDPQDNPLGRRVIIEKGSVPEADIVLLERATSRPADWTNPTLREDDNELVLWVLSFYWGVRRMICNVATARTTTAEPRSLHTLPTGRTEWRST